MTTYLVCLNGRNFLIDGDKGPRKRRVCSTRLVEAENPKQAETLAIEFFRNDIRLQKTVLNEPSDPPTISLEGVKEISATGFDAQIRATALYWEDEDAFE